jgi:hypothetical protein
MGKLAQSLIRKGIMKNFMPLRQRKNKAKQSQFYLAPRPALGEFEKTKPILVSPQIYSGG